MQSNNDAFTFLDKRMNGSKISGAEDLSQDKSGGSGSAYQIGGTPANNQLFKSRVENELVLKLKRNYTFNPNPVEYQS